MSFLDGITKSEFVSKHIAKTMADPGYAAKAMVTMNVMKDVFAYSAKAYTSFKNKDIPEEQRPLVAMADASSGVLTAMLQILIGFSIATPKNIDKMWQFVSKGASEAVQNSKGAKSLFSTIVAVGVSVVAAERIIVPMIANPLGSMLKNKFAKKPDGEGVEKSGADGASKTEKPSDKNSDKAEKSDKAESAPTTEKSEKTANTEKSEKTEKTTKPAETSESKTEKA